MKLLVGNGVNDNVKNNNAMQTPEDVVWDL